MQYEDLNEISQLKNLLNRYEKECLSEEIERYASKGRKGV